MGTNSETATCTWSELPKVLLYDIFRQVPVKTRLSCCTLVCKAWSEAATAATDALVLHGCRNSASLAHWISKYSNHITVLHLENVRPEGEVSCTQLLQRLQMLRSAPPKAEACTELLAGSQFCSGIAAATRLTSISLDAVSFDASYALPGAELAAALAALPDLQQLCLKQLHFTAPPTSIRQRLTQAPLSRPTTSSSAFMLPFKAVLPQLLPLTSLQLSVDFEAADLNNISCLTNLLQLRLHLAVAPGASAQVQAAELEVLQELQGLTELQLWNLGALPAFVSKLSALQHLKAQQPCEASWNSVKQLQALTYLHLADVRARLLYPPLLPSGPSYQLTALQHLELSAPFQHTAWLKETLSLTVLGQQLSSSPHLKDVYLRYFMLQDTFDWTACRKLEKLTLMGCELPPAQAGDTTPSWQHIFPDSADLSHLTALHLSDTGPPIQPRDLQMLVAACSRLRQLELSRASLPALQLAALTQLPELTSLTVSEPDNKGCRVLAQLTGLVCLRVVDPRYLSTHGLSELTALQQLSRLSFHGTFNSGLVSEQLQSQLTACSSDDGSNRGMVRDGHGMPLCTYGLSNQAPSSSPPDVWYQLLMACSHSLNC